MGFDHSYLQEFEVGHTLNEEMWEECQAELTVYFNTLLTVSDEDL